MNKVTTFKTFDTQLIRLVEVFTDDLFEAISLHINEPDGFVECRKQYLEIVTRLSFRNSAHKWDDFQGAFFSVREQLDQDALAIEQTDPAVKSLEEVYLAYPGFFAITIYRLSHLLYGFEAYTFARMMSEHAHRKTGIDIHPGAQIGVPFYIDHGTGIVIGETTIIRNNVKIYQGVTLGGLQVKKELAAIKRHPTLEDNVTVYANATILGGNIAIGANSVIGANVWITKSIPKNSIVVHKSEVKIRKK